MNACDMPAVDFFTVTRYEYETASVCDFSDAPRPHFCLGFILDGEADFFPSDEQNGAPVHVSRGELIFVPITSRYVSRWYGSPHIRYISYHFSFVPGTGISERNNFLLQRLTVDAPDTVRALFEEAHRDFGGTGAERFGVLGGFYSLLSSLLPRLAHSREKSYDERIEKAVEYIRLHADEELSIPALATLCNISISHFYTKFKSEVGMTPVDYKNAILVTRATRMLLYETERSVEAISDALGFTSATYFRRVFKKITGKTPIEYRRSAAEL